MVGSMIRFYTAWDILSNAEVDGGVCGSLAW